MSDSMVSRHYTAPVARRLPTGTERAYDTAAHLMGLRDAPAAKYRRERLLKDVAAFVFAFRSDPDQLGRFSHDVQRALGLSPDALPALPESLCTATVEGAEATAALAQFYRDQSAENLQRALKEGQQSYGAAGVALAAMQAELERRAE